MEMDSREALETMKQNDEWRKQQKIREKQDIYNPVLQHTEEKQVQYRDRQQQAASESAP